MCEGASKQSSNLKHYTAPGPRPGSKIPGSGTGIYFVILPVKYLFHIHLCFINIFNYCMEIYKISFVMYAFSQTFQQCIYISFLRIKNQLQIPKITKLRNLSKPKITL